MSEKEYFRFGLASLHNFDCFKYWFECAMVSSCAPVFDDLEDNYEVEQRLREAGVIDETCDCDSETCALVVNFIGKVDGLAFLSRLNKYLSDWHKSQGV